MLCRDVALFSRDAVHVLPPATVPILTHICSVYVELQIAAKLISETLCIVSHYRKFVAFLRCHKPPPHFKTLSRLIFTRFSAGASTELYVHNIISIENCIREHEMPQQCKYSRILVQMNQLAKKRQLSTYTHLAADRLLETPFTNHI